SCTRTPSMSVSQVSTGLRSLTRTMVPYQRFRLMPSAGPLDRPATVVWAEIPGRNPSEPVTNHTLGVQPLVDQLLDQCDKTGVDAGGRGPRDAQPEPFGRLGGLDVEVPEHLEVIGDEPDRAHHDLGDPALGQGFEVVVDVRL